MSEIGQYVFNGLMLGMIYAMVAVGSKHTHFPIGTLVAEHNSSYLNI